DRGEVDVAVVRLEAAPEDAGLVRGGIARDRGEQRLGCPDRGRRDVGEGDEEGARDARGAELVARQLARGEEGEGLADLGGELDQDGERLERLEEAARLGIGDRGQQEVPDLVEVRHVLRRGERPACQDDPGAVRGRAGRAVGQGADLALRLGAVPRGGQQLRAPQPQRVPGGGRPGGAVDRIEEGAGAGAAPPLPGARGEGLDGVGDVVRVLVAEEGGERGRRAVRLVELYGARGPLEPGFASHDPIDGGRGLDVGPRGGLVGEGEAGPRPPEGREGGEVAAVARADDRAVEPGQCRGGLAEADGGRAEVGERAGEDAVVVRPAHQPFERGGRLAVVAAGEVGAPDEVQGVVGPAAVGVPAQTPGRLLDGGAVVRVRGADVAARGGPLGVGEVAPGVVERVEVRAGGEDQRSGGADERGAPHDVGSVSQRYSCEAKNSSTASASANAIFCWNSEEPSSRASRGSEMNAISTSTAGMNAPMRTTNPPCLTPRFGPGWNAAMRRCTISARLLDARR